jgi:hypothetical protein
MSDMLTGFGTVSDLCSTHCGTVLTFGGPNIFLLSLFNGQKKITGA